MNMRVDGHATPTSARRFSSALKQKWRVMHAVMLRDLRSRYFNHGLGFFIVILWPLAHLSVLLAIYMMLDRRSPYGDNLYLFFATGLIPTLSFMYVSRFMAMSLNMNQTMLSLPVVRANDILFGRALLETLAACIMAFLTLGLLLLLEVDPVPADIVAAVAALGATLLLAIGTGMIIGVLAQLFPFILTFYFLATIALYLLSGTLFVASFLPSDIAYALSWNPVLHGTEWMRSAYYPGYPTQVLDRSYMVGCAIVAFFLGLLLERVLRPWILQR